MTANTIEPELLALLKFDPDAAEKAEARARAKDEAWAELSDVLVDETNRATLLGVPFVDDDGVPGHIFVFGGDPDALRQWVFLTGENAFFNIVTGERVSRAAFDLAMAKITPTIKITKDGGDSENKKFAASRTLVEFLNGAVVSGTMYRPDIGTPVLDFEQKRWANSYLQGSVPVAESNWHRHPAWLVVRQHIHNIIPDGADLIVKWMAHNVQFPGVKIHWAPVIVGVEGDGKTTIGMDVMAAAMGAAHVRPVSPESMFSEFTGWASGACVRVLEEIRIAGERRTAAMDKLKPLITNATVEIVRKGVDGKDQPNVTNYIALTNHIDALAITPGDRRWAVFRTRFRDRQHLLSEIKPEYWRELRDAIENHPGVIRSWLLSIDLTGFDRTAAPPVTAAKLAMVEASGSPVSGEISEAIALGGFGITSDVVATDCLNDRIKDLGGRPLNSKALNAILTEAGWVRHALVVKWRGKSRRLYYRPKMFRGAEDLELSRRLRILLETSDEARTSSEDADLWP